MLKVIVIAGTTEARQLIAGLCVKRDLEIHATVTTGYGVALLESLTGIRIHRGPLDAQGMLQLVEALEPKLVIDASHPFALQATANAQLACQKTGVPYVRYERENTKFDQSQEVICVPDFGAAAATANAIAGNILLTIGSNHLAEFVQGVPGYRERLYVRVLPTGAVLHKCEELGLTARQIIAIQGPFTTQMNLELLHYSRARVLVTKDSGATGGNTTKLAAARELRVPVIMVERPESDNSAPFSSLAEIHAYVQKLIEVQNGIVSPVH